MPGQSPERRMQEGDYNMAVLPGGDFSLSLSLSLSGVYKYPMGGDGKQ